MSYDIGTLRTLTFVVIVFGNQDLIKVPVFARLGFAPGARAA
jgi:hypothetical protein